MPRPVIGTKVMTWLALAASLAACSSPGAQSPNSLPSAGGAGNAGAVAAPAATADAEDSATAWDAASATVVELQGDTARVNGPGAALNGSDVYLVSAGTYVLRGSLTDGQVVVDAQTKGTVRIILDGVELHNEDSAAIYVKQADKTIITLAEGTHNVVSDGPNYADTTTEDAPKAAIYSMDDLVINGAGRLTVEGYFDVGIMSKDDLRIMGGELLVKAVDDGLVGRDQVYITDGSLTVESGGDAIKTTNDKDPAKGYVAIEGGTIRLNAGGDGIQAESSIHVSGGDFIITTNGGSQNGAQKTETFPPFGPRGDRRRPGMPGQPPTERTGTGMPGQPPTEPPGSGMALPPGAAGQPTSPGTGVPPIPSVTATGDAPSAKGLKALDIVIAGGRLQIDSADDAVHGNNSVRIAAGELVLRSGDDGIHADNALWIDGGTIAIQKSYEGLESLQITIAGGEVHVVASDDGINVAGGADGSSINGRWGQNAFGSGTGALRIEGGEIFVEAAGDGVDSNGSIAMSGGTLRVNGPTANMNGALDYDGTFEITGGTLIAAGSAGMAQAPSAQSPQSSVALFFTAPPAAGTVVSLRDSAGNVLLSMELRQAYPTVVFSTPELKQGESYAIYAGDQEVVRFTLENRVTWLNESGVTTAPRGGPFGRR